jgi:hypothetical protein
MRGVHLAAGADAQVARCASRAFSGGGGWKLPALARLRHWVRLGPAGWIHGPRARIGELGRALA